MKNSGIWIRFENPEDYLKLYELTKNVSVEWKTKHSGNAQYFLNNGSVLVYCTKDEEGIPRIPRIQIILNDKNRVSFAWGIAQYENIEPELLDILDQKLDEINDKKFLHKPRIHDMKLLSLIEEKTKNNQELSIEEIQFLYEFETEIKCFGFAKDSRISELKNIRNTAEDMNRVFRTMDDYDRDLTLNFVSFADGLEFPKKIKGNFNLKKVKVLNNCKLPEYIEGDINMPKVKKLKNVIFGSSVLGDFNLESLEQADHTVFPENLEGSMHCGNLKITKSVIFPRYMKGTLYLNSWNSHDKTILPEECGNIQVTSLNKPITLPKKFNNIYAPPGFQPNYFSGYPNNESIEIKEETKKQL